MFSEPRVAKAPPLYEADFVQWIDSTVEMLRDRNYSQVDWENLIDEVLDMSKRERQALEGNLIVVLLHLLKWQYQLERRSGSWRGSIREHRRRIARALKDSPSLKPYLNEIFSDCYADARLQAADETQLHITIFPEACPYEIAEALLPDFLSKE